MDASIHFLEKMVSLLQVFAPGFLIFARKATFFMEEVDSFVHDQNKKQA